MDSVNLTILLAVLRLAFAKEPVDIHPESTPADLLASRLFSQFNDRSLLHLVDLDATTVGKSGHLVAMPSSPARHNSLQSRPLLPAKAGRPPVHAGWQRTRRPLILVRAEDEEKKEEGYKFGDITKGIFKAGVKKDYKTGDMTKAAVEAATGNKDYEFGDMTKAAAKKAMEAAGQALEAGAAAREVATEVGKELTGDENYEVGDVTKAAVQAAAKEAGERISGDTEKLKAAAEAAGKVITEDEKYKFGDITKGIFKGAKGMLDKAGKAMDEGKSKDE
jgi:hypothetical protein